MARPGTCASLTTTLASHFHSRNMPRRVVAGTSLRSGSRQLAMRMQKLASRGPKSVFRADSSASRKTDRLVRQADAAVTSHELADCLRECGFDAPALFRGELRHHCLRAAQLASKLNELIRRGELERNHHGRNGYLRETGCFQGGL